jgi:hypothetical protein
MADRAAPGALDGDAERLAFREQAPALPASDFLIFFHGKHPCAFARSFLRFLWSMKNLFFAASVTCANRSRCCAVTVCLSHMDACGWPPICRNGNPKYAIFIIPHLLLIVPAHIIFLEKLGDSPWTEGSLSMNSWTSKAAA